LFNSHNHPFVCYPNQHRLLNACFNHDIAYIRISASEMESSTTCEAENHRDLVNPIAADFFPETLTAEIKAIFTNDASLMGAQPTLSAAFTVLAGAGKPNSVVCHFWKRLSGGGGIKCQELI